MFNNFIKSLISLNSTDKTIIYYAKELIHKITYPFTINIEGIPIGLFLTGTLIIFSFVKIFEIKMKDSNFKIKFENLLKNKTVKTITIGSIIVLFISVLVL